MRSSDLSKVDLPLLGKKILVTRAGQQGQDFANRLIDLGAEPVLMPMIEISPPDSWHQLDQAIKNIDTYQWLLFASSNAVISFTNRWQYQAATNKKLPPIAAIGDTTARTARKLGLKVEYSPEIFLAEDFIKHFPGYPDHLKNTKILWPRTNYGRDYIKKSLENAGAIVKIVPAYKTDLPKNAHELSEQLKIKIHTKAIDVITLASKQTAVNLATILNLSKSSFQQVDSSAFISRNSPLPQCREAETLAKLKDTLQGILIVTIGPETSAGALNYLGKVDKEAIQHSAEGMINALIEHYKGKQ
jgi:uroporphyrinogen-III synthase